MQRMRTYFVFLAITSLLVSCAVKEKKLSSLQLSNTKGKIVLLSEIKNHKTSVFVFLKPDCPLSQNYTLTLNNLFTEFKDYGINFTGIIPCCVTNSEATDFVMRYKILFQVLHDHENKTATFFNATCTPEVFVIDKNETVLYSGAIDDWATSIGKHRTVTTRHYLRDALVQIKNNLAVELKKTQPIGCVL